MMFAYLKGNMTYRAADYVVIDVQGVGYKVFTTVASLANIKLEQIVQLFTYLNVRETEMTLYGFVKQSDLQLFELLITVSGIGPKVALNILNHIRTDDFVVAVMSDDEKSLTKLPGIGKKTAKRIILDLKEKLSHSHDMISDMATSADSLKDFSSAVDEVIAALQALGYDSAVARRTAQQQYKNNPQSSVPQLLRQCLRNLSTI